MLRPALLTVEIGPELRRRIEPAVFRSLFAEAARAGTRSPSITQAKELLAIAVPRYREVVSGAAPALAGIGPVPLRDVGTLLHQALQEATRFFRREGARTFRAVQKLDDSEERAARLWHALFSRRLLPWLQASGKLGEPDALESIDVVVESVKLWVRDLALQLGPRAESEIAPAAFFLDTEGDLKATLVWEGRRLELRGRPDALVVNRTSGRPEVIEYKLGKHGQVELQVAQTLLYLALVNEVKGPGFETARLQLFRLEAETPPDAPIEVSEEPEKPATTVPAAQTPPSGFPPQVEAAFAGYIGNVAAVRRLKIECTLAFRATPPSMPVNVMLCGPGGLGKTELARRVARALGVPLVDVPASRIKNVDGLLDLVDGALAAAGQSAEEAGTDSGLPRRAYPPVVIFLDEIHLMGKRADLFLNVFEPKERRAVGSKAVGDFRHATFLGATTDKGLLPGAFLTRFRMVDLVPYSADEVAEIVRPVFEAHPVETDFLLRLAHMSRFNPRETLVRAQELLTHHRFDASMYPLDLGGLRRMASESWQVDEHGLRQVDHRYLRALEGGRRGLEALTQLLPVGRDEIKTVIEPYLLQLELIRLSGAGRELSEQGRRLVTIPA
ncbi:MAG: PD-(D/E)XK nuclease family protein [Pseudomonadota bacterium]|nr:PD-(D/E)XK nuclease family protein [Pseudomonadota bacterium]